ncbi:hypothetical protein [Citrobacter braakii]|uniref:hypothetical protein n=1 Tax=Citrobacter braakii TaxID=57706 RepID=UPI001CC6ECE7|nr:hypothetical protein [Citrobacter braakii]
MRSGSKIKIFNTLLLTIVATLLIVAILVVIKILFSGSKGLEWVTLVGAWCSAAGTLGTLWVAYLAYLKAPAWLSQKHYDVVYSVIEKAIYQDLIKVRSASLILKNHLVTFSKKYRNHLKNETIPQNSFDDFMKETDALVSDLFIISYSVTNALKSINRTNYVMSDYTNNIITNIQSHTEKYNDLSIEFFIASSDVPSLIAADESFRNQTSSELLAIQLKAISFHSQLSNFIKEIYNNNYPIDQFITLKGN